MNTRLRRGSSAAGRACEWAAIRQAAERGEANAQFSLGIYHSSAKGKAFDYAKAAQWYRKAAEQEHVLAQFNLGVMFARGQGVPQDEEQAADWMHKAGERGDAGGQHSLGLRCARASLDPLTQTASESRIEAYKWLRLAAIQGYGGSHAACRGLMLVMTPAELEEGHARVGTFAVRGPAPECRVGEGTG